MAEEINTIQYLGLESLKALSVAISKNYVSHAELESVLAGLDSSPATSTKFYKINSENKTASGIIADGELLGTSFNQGDFLYGVSADSQYILFYYSLGEWVEISRSEKSAGGTTVDIDYATTETAGIVRPFEEDFEISTETSTKGLMKLKPVAIKKVTGLQEALDLKANITDVYTREEVNNLLLSHTTTAESLATISVANPNNLGEIITTTAVGTVANTVDPSSGKITGTYILTQDSNTGTKSWTKIESASESVDTRISNVEDAIEEIQTWSTF